MGIAEAAAWADVIMMAPKGPGHTVRGEYTKGGGVPVSYTHLRAHETDSYLVCRLLLEKMTQSG